MPVRLAFPHVALPAGGFLASYWGPLACVRPIIDVYVVGPTGMVLRVRAQVDSASDCVGFDPQVAHRVGIHPPFARQMVASGAAGAQALSLSFPPDGVVSLFVTDYKEFYYLPDPPVGFHVPPPGAVPAPTSRSVLGFTGFMQYFKTCFDPEPTPPSVELTHITTFAGQHGRLPRSIAVVDFVRNLKMHP